MIRDGDIELRQATAALGINLAALVARTSLWASLQTWHELRQTEPLGVWFPDTRRFRRGANEKRGQLVGFHRLDDNTYANIAAKLAIVGERTCVNYSVCHVWEGSCYDVRYHTNIANLVLVPKAIAGLTDHDDLTIQSMRYRAFELFGWHPEDQPPPERPVGYPTQWIEPSINPKVLRALDRRKRGRLRL